jgi:hypothetical protein
MSPDAPEGSPPLVELLGQVQWMLREAESEEQIFDAENCAGPPGAARAPVAFPTAGQFLRGGLWAQPPQTAVSGPPRSRDRGDGDLRRRLDRRADGVRAACGGHGARRGPALPQPRSFSPGDSSLGGRRSITGGYRWLLVVSLAFLAHTMGLNHAGGPQARACRALYRGSTTFIGVFSSAQSATGTVLPQ